MVNIFTPAETEVVINRSGQRAVKINNEDILDNNYPRLLNFRRDKQINIFIRVINEEEIHVCQIVKGGYNILYIIRINLLDEINSIISNIYKYLEDILIDNNIELHSYMKGYLESYINYILEDILGGEING